MPRRKRKLDLGKESDDDVEGFMIFFIFFFQVCPSPTVTVIQIEIIRSFMIKG